MVKTSHLWKKIAEMIEQGGGVYRDESNGRFGLCYAIRDVSEHDLDKILVMKRQLHLLKPSGDEVQEFYWFAGGKLFEANPSEARTLAAWLLYYMALDEEANQT